MSTHPHQASKRGDGKLPGRLHFASSSVLLPDGNRLETRIDLQEGGGYYVSTTIIAKDNDIKAGQTCFYCDGVKIGCMTCPKGESPSGNCIDKTIKCEKDNAFGAWNPGELVFALA